jgi:ATP-dependent 26S proteasome regulatory subunit
MIADADVNPGIDHYQSSQGHLARRTRRAGSEFIGVLVSGDEEFYNNKITQLEREQSDLIKLSREQMVVVKSTLKSVNKTLNDVSNNELILENGLTEIKKFVNKENREIKEKYTYTAMLVALNDHAIQIQRALEEVKDEYNILIQSCMNAKQGIMQPQVLSPRHLIEVLKTSRDSFPRDLQVPVTLSEAYL